jgi:hypothetical protein
VSKPVQVSFASAPLSGNISDHYIVFATRMAEEPEILKAIWQDFLPSALASGQFLPKPDPILIEGGLENAQEALNRQKAGVRQAKVVLKL